MPHSHNRTSIRPTQLLIRLPQSRQKPNETNFFASEFLPKSASGHSKMHPYCEAEIPTTTDLEQNHRSQRVRHDSPALGLIPQPLHSVIHPTTPLIQLFIHLALLSSCQASFTQDALGGHLRVTSHTSPTLGAHTHGFRVGMGAMLLFMGGYGFCPSLHPTSNRSQTSRMHGIC